MYFGEMKIDVQPNFGNSFFTKIKEAKEGKRILKLNPQYKEVKKDETIESDREFYITALYKYMVDCVLKEYPLLKPFYEDVWLDYKTKYANNQHPYGRTSVTFLYNYKEYLRKAENPETEELIKRDLELNAIQHQKEKEEQDRKLRKQAEEEAQKRKAEQEWAERQAAFQLQQDLASCKRVVCPYCHSTNTEKISTVSRAVSVSLVGAASGKIGKQWHCKNCGSNF